jgi:hypothetical protein
MAGAHRNQRTWQWWPLIAVVAMSAGFVVGGGAAVSATASADTTSCSTPFTTSNPPNPQLLVPYHSQIVASGGAAPYTFKKISGSLPPGLALSSSGVLSGIPTRVGFFEFDYQVTDSAPTPCSYVYFQYMRVSSGTPTGDSVLLWVGDLASWLATFNAPAFVACLEAEANTLLYSQPPNTDCQYVLVPPLPPIG